MNNTWHIHISGMVQGVGFRPFVHRLATELKINGTVSNTNDGVHILFNAAEHAAFGFYKSVVDQSPKNAVITYHQMQPAKPAFYSGFSIIESKAGGKPDLLLTPDIATCEVCRKEIADINNHRYRYPFTTCLHCGPRYSIVKQLPYDRCNTTMEDMEMCSLCKKEYHNLSDRRHYSQTNTCPECSLAMHLYSSKGKELSSERETIFTTVNLALDNGHIIAVKGVGGYLLLCDATNAEAINLLRNRKQRPTKPFAVLYGSAQLAERDVILTRKEKAALESKAAPIVLCTFKEDEKGSGICKELVAPNLGKLGVMLPYTGMLQVIAEQIRKPLIATSANLHGSPIIYKDDDAVSMLTAFADFVVTFDRDIVAPQDDSVIQFTQVMQQQIILRRSRGLAPNYFPNPFVSATSLFAAGADMKASFALHDRKYLYISQFLGDQGNFESQLSYKATAEHLASLLHFKPEHILVDKHPNYYSSAFGKEEAGKNTIPVTEIQHHKAHFAAVLAENELLGTQEPVLGVVWDGTGYGDDGQVWGGEFFRYEHNAIARIAHFNYFPHLMGDRMSKEPRLSALSLLHDDEDMHQRLLKPFNQVEAGFLYKLIHQPHELLTSSMGRILDGIASLLEISHVNNYEGEAAMRLETLANTANDRHLSFYEIPLVDGILDWRPMIAGVLECKRRRIPNCRIAFKVFASLANCIRETAITLNIKQVAFSGGVFQNALLIDLIEQLMGKQFKLYFHRHLSPNDECIGFGQIANYLAEHAADSIYNTSKQTTCV